MRRVRSRFLRLHGAPLLAALTAACTQPVAGPVSPDVTVPAATTNALALRGAWPAWMQNAQHSGTSSALVNTDGMIRWSVPLVGAAAGSPVVAADGTIYALTSGALNAVASDGSLRWRTTVNAVGGHGAPAVGDDGAIYLADQARAYRMLSSGTTSWSVALPCPATEAVTLTSNAVLISTSCRLLALDPLSGATLWRYPATTDVGVGPAAVSSDGSIYTVDANGALVALSSAGARRWVAPLGVPVSAPTVLQDGRIAVLDRTGQLRLFQADQTVSILPLMGVRPCNGTGMAQALDGSLRIISCGAFGMNVELLDLALDGTERWRAALGPVSRGLPSVAADGTTVVASTDGSVQAFSASDGAPTWGTGVGAVQGAAALGADGVAYVLDDTGTLTAIGQRCTPQCFNRECGNDLCGGSCGQCNAPAQCFASPGLCDVNGACQYPAALNGTACADGRGCTQGDTCNGGTCVSGPAPCVDGNSCTSDVCMVDLTRFTTGNAAFLDISGTGTITVDGDDNVSGPIPMGFTLDLFGTPVDTAFISTNGYITFDGVDAYSNTSMPDGNPPNGMLAPFWDDLVAQPGAIRFKTLGTSGDHRFVVQWTNVQMFSGNGSSLTFEVIVSESTGGVEFRYSRLAGNPRPQARGNSATVGIESLDGTQAALFSFNRASLNVGTTLQWNREAFTCSNPPAPPGSRCDDGNACTGGDICINGMCSGTPVMCPPPVNPCQSAGLCDPVTGSCSFVALPDGTACDTVVNACSSGTCRAGTCVGGTPVVCPPRPCFVASCDAMAGCVYSPLPPGGACDDGNACTFGDVCDGMGSCAGKVYSCVPNVCESASSCDGQGGCTATRASDGTACVDNKGCSDNDVCTQGVCGGTPTTACTSMDPCLTPSCSNVENGAILPGSGDLLDIRNTGTISVDGDDVISGPVPLGFTFHFYGVAHTTVRLTTNGYVTFGGADPSPYTNETIPSANDPNDYLAPFWDDLMVNPGTLRYQTLGSAPHRRFVVQWTDALFFGDNAARLTFELILTEGTDGVEFRYGSMQSSNPLEAAGSSATIGVEDPTGRTGQLFSFNRPSVRPGVVLRWQRTGRTCGFSNAPDGTQCTDNNGCTDVDHCVGGRCSGLPITCVPAGVCRASSCDAMLAMCVDRALPDGTPCPGGSCVVGNCVPSGVDAGPRPDAAVTTDAAVQVDAGRPDAAVIPDAGRPDGAVIGDAGRPDGAVIVDAGRPDGAVIADAGRPDGAVVADAGRPDGAVVVDGSVPTDGSVVVMDGSVVTMDGSVVVTDGSVVTMDGSIVAMDGSVVVMDGSVVTMDGSISPDGSVSRDAGPGADGSVVARDAGPVDAAQDPGPPFTYVNLPSGCSAAAVSDTRAPLWCWLLLVLALRRSRKAAP